ncbi:unnamed protein product, partial [Rotaria magnacalcarata]
DWWTTFGYPAAIDEKNIFQRITGYVSCFKCYGTFVYGSNSGTTRLKQHVIKCSKVACSSSITIESSDLASRQSTLAHHGFKKTIKLNENDVDKIKNLSAQWVCQDMRPFSTLEDVGFRALAQELVNIGHRYGVIDIDEILRSRYTIARTIYDLADSYRQRMKQILSEPLKARAVTICPDFWSDCYKNISYLGLNITFVDVDYKMFSIDLFCRPFFGVKTSTSILKVLQEHIVEFGIDDLALVNIVSDRGSNFVAAFRDSQPLFCFGHRLNNIVKTTFFGNINNKKKPTSNAPTTVNRNVAIVSTTIKPNDDNILHANDVSTSEQSSEDDDDYVLPSIPVKQKSRAIHGNSSYNNHKLVRKMSIHDIPLEAHNVIIALSQCKKIVKYIKKSGLNKEIENSGGGTVHQSIAIRWVSMIETLESILRSFKIIKRILVIKRQQKLTNNIDEKIIKQIILLLKPFKHVIKLIQTGCSPSLYMVLLSFQTLVDTMSSYKALLDYNFSDGDRQSKEESPELDDDLIDELRGINLFWNRIHCLLNAMFTLDIRHYVATAFHLKYWSLHLCSTKERAECYEHTRKQLKLINIECNAPNERQTDKPLQKKFKKDLFSRFESDNFGDGEKSEESDEDIEVSSHGKKNDELDRYLNLEIDRSKLEYDPLPFWKKHQDKFPHLSRYARSIHSIPATSASVERQFSGAGLVINERRTNLKPEQLDNVLLIRSMQKNKITL